LLKVLTSHQLGVTSALTEARPYLLLFVGS
jgi:hypothetical protein